MVQPQTIRFFEELSINAWPALQTSYDDGWVMRVAGGYTRRANCVNPLYPAADDLTAKVERAEAWYRSRGQDTVFKLTEQAQPAGLDDLLIGRGYQEASRSHVKQRSLADVQAPDERPVSFASSVSAEWLTAFCRMHSYDLTYYLPLMTAMLERLVPQACFASMQQDGQIVAVGIGVIDRGYIGLYDMVTDRAYRGRGLARQLILSLLRWGKSNGAENAYLMVASTNEPAIRLYSALGYQQMYSYWYRVKKA